MSAPLNTAPSPDIRDRLGLRKVINVSGTMTSLGASIIVPEAIEAMAAIAPQFVEIDDLQRKASAVIAKACGTEAGFVTASCSSGISVAVAGCMTGDRLLAIENLPDATGLKTEVPIQLGHMVSYGAPVSQGIALTGATPVPLGTVSHCGAYHLEQSINERTAAAVYVVSHHTVQYGMIPLPEFAKICRAHSVPVIVDAASEYDLKGFLEQGADVAIYSGHKFLGGPTSGIVAGRKDLIRAGFLQNRGLGRGMKVGKETVAGCMAALEAWGHRDHVAVRERERSYLNLWLKALASLPGIVLTLVPDPTNNPLDRLKINVGPESGFTAASLAAALAAGDPPVIVRGHEAERGHFFLDPCNLHPGEADIVATRIVEVLRSNRARFPDKAPVNPLAWPD